MTVTGRIIILAFATLQFFNCKGQSIENTTSKSVEKRGNAQPFIFKQNTLFPQIHTNLNGMVREFIRAMYQDKKGNYWFGTNGNGIVRYDGKNLVQMKIDAGNKWISVREIVEDKEGNVWFGTSDGLIQYDGEKMTKFSEKEGLPDEEIWGLVIDKQGIIWIGTIEGVSQFDGKRFISFSLPNTKVPNPLHMLSDKLVTKFMEDKNGVMWLVTDGNGIFKYEKGAFTHLTNKNGLTDNNIADILEDRKGNVWIGTFFGGVSKFDGNTYTNFTKDGMIDGIETYNFLEDSKGNIWFSAENIGVYKYDGTKFSLYTNEDGLTTNGIQSIMEDKKGQLWFGTWQGICLYDGEKFMNANIKESWTK